MRPGHGGPQVVLNGGDGDASPLELVRRSLQVVHEGLQEPGPPAAAAKQVGRVPVEVAKPADRGRHHQATRLLSLAVVDAEAGCHGDLVHVGKFLREPKVTAKPVEVRWQYPMGGAGYETTKCDDFH
jgi:hypothetical protein